MVIVPALYGLYFMGARADCIKISTLASVALIVQLYPYTAWIQHAVSIQ